MSQLSGPVPGLANDRTRIWSAFAAAVAIHGLVIAIGSLFPPDAELVIGLPTGAVDVTIQSELPADPISPPEPVVSSPPPPAVSASLFHEEIEPTEQLREQTTRPITKPRQRILGSSSSSSSSLALSAPAPEYPAEARIRNLSGSGVVIMTVNPANGRVIHVSMAASTGVPSLDNAALRGFRRWRFRPGGVSKVRSPVTFTLTAIAN